MRQNSQSLTRGFILARHPEFPEGKTRLFFRETPGRTGFEVCGNWGLEMAFAAAAVLYPFFICADRQSMALDHALWTCDE